MTAVMPQIEGGFGAILADPPWRFEAWNKFKELSDGTMSRAVERYYPTMTLDEICELPVAESITEDCALFLWATWPMLKEALQVIEAWGFAYKTCAFDWMKGDARQLELFHDDIKAMMGMGYWTRSNSEPCLLATKGKPQRLDASVRMGIIEPRREHSRKPDCVHDRIERLVAGPYLELFARQSRPGWASWGNETTKFAGAAA